MKGGDKGNRALRIPVAPVVFTSDSIRHKLKRIFMLEGRTLHQASSQSPLGRFVPIRGHASGRAYEKCPNVHLPSDLQRFSFSIRHRASGLRLRVVPQALSLRHGVRLYTLITEQIGTCQVCPMAYVFVRGNTAYPPAFYSSQYLLVVKLSVIAGRCDPTSTNLSL